MSNARKFYISHILKSAILAFVFVYSNIAFAEGFTHTDIDYRVCFTPQGNCTGLIINEIATARKSIYVQAYSFTSSPIMRALVMAKKRGVDVKVLLDKRQANAKRYFSANSFAIHNIPVWVDYKPAIAHNKVMIIDDSTVITGSFNFTNAAQYRNAENLLILRNNILAKKYLENWHSRWTESEVISKLPQTNDDQYALHNLKVFHKYKKSLSSLRKKGFGNVDG